MTKPREKTREELQTEIEDGKKKIRQFENGEQRPRQSPCAVRGSGQRHQDRQAQDHRSRQVQNGGTEEGRPRRVRYTIFLYVILAPIVNAVLTALFIGNDYSSGTMRSKRIAGHRRGIIYLANLLVCICAGICLCLAFALPQAAVGLPLKGETNAAPATLLLYVGLSFARMIAFTALFILIAMLCQNKSHTTAGCIHRGRTVFPVSTATALARIRKIMPT